MNDNTTLKGIILQHDDDEVKVLNRGIVYMILKKDIISPKNIRVKNSNIFTTIETENGKMIHGKVIKDVENTIVISNNFRNEKIDKSTIVYQSFYIRNYYQETETFIKTKDGHLLVGDVIKSDNNITRINLGNGMIQDIRNETILESSDKFKPNKNLIKSLIYGLAGLVGLIVLVGI